MTHNPPAARVVRRSVSVALASGLILSVAACTPTADFVPGSRDAARDGPAPIGAAPASERDVEAPEVFDVADEGLWDGRPSLGGVWVAHPGATDPERVIIRNTETGRFVIGALFRRERENPGPPLQVSSEAAAALDLLAGNPTNLQVTALRRADPPPEDEGEAIAETQATADITQTADTPAAGDPGAAAPVAADTPEPAAPAPGGFLAALNRVLGTGTRPEDAATDTSGDTSDNTATDTTATPAPAPARPRNMSAGDVASGIGAAAFSTTELEAIRPVPAVAAAGAAIAESQAALRVPAPARTTPTSPDTPLGRAFVQVGLFSVRENAEAAGQALRSAGLVPTIREENGTGRRSWRVVVGPAPTGADRAAVLETVRGAGFEDAYFVSR
jgi:cell division septation protein DedD